MIPATNGKSIYIPPQGDWRLRRYDEASTLDETVLTVLQPLARLSPSPDSTEQLEPLSGFRLISKHPPYGLKDALVFWTPSVRTPTPDFCILPQLRPSSGRFGSERIQLMNPVFCVFFFAKWGFCFCVYYSSGGNRRGLMHERPSDRRTEYSSSLITHQGRCSSLKVVCARIGMVCLRRWRLDGTIKARWRGGSQAVGVLRKKRDVNLQ